MTETPSQTKYRPKKTFSLDEKRTLCEAWKASGISKQQFCKEHQISTSALYCWQKEFATKEAKRKKSWSPVRVSTPKHIEPTRQNLVEIILSNQMTMRVSLSFSKIKSLLRGLANATTIIR